MQAVHGIRDKTNNGFFISFATYSDVYIQSSINIPWTATNMSGFSKTGIVSRLEMIKLFHSFFPDKQERMLVHMSFTGVLSVSCCFVFKSQSTSF